MAKVRLSLPVKTSDVYEAVRKLTHDLRLTRSPHRAAGMTMAQAQALLEIEKCQPLNVAQLTELLNLDKSTVSQTLSQLLRHGWIRLQELPFDRRHKVIEITSDGRQRVNTLYTELHTLYEKLMTHLEEKEKNAVVYGLQLLSYAIQQEHQSPSQGEVKKTSARTSTSLKPAERPFGAKADL